MSHGGVGAAQIIDGGPLGLTVPGNRWDLLPTPAEPPSVSVIIPFFEQHDELARVLAGLGTQRGPVVINEVVVVDDGSRHAPELPPTLTIGDAPWGTAVPLVVLRQEDRGRRPAAARNLGATVATGDVLVFFDGDTVPAPDAVARLAALPAVAPATVVVGRRDYRALDGWCPEAVAAWLDGGSAAAPQMFERPAWLDERYAASADLLELDERSYQLVIGAIMATSRAFFEEIGGFDASIDCYGGEDWEIAYRAWCAGAILAHVPDAVGHHHGPDWRGREGRDATKNPERMALIRTIPGRADAIRGPYARVVATVDGRWPADAVIATVASVLDAGGNQVRVVVADASAAVAAVVAHDNRVTCGVLGPDVAARSVVRIDLVSPSTITATTIERLGESLTTDRGRIVVRDAAGVVLVATATRAAARAHRFAASFTDADEAIRVLFGTRDLDTDVIGVRRLDRRVDLEEIFRR